MSDSDSGREYTAFDLREMGEQEARETLTVAQFERWEDIQDLTTEADETEAEWEAQAETVAEVTVHADMTDLGTEIELYGNDLVVHADPEDPDFRERAQTLEGEFGDIDSDDVREEALDGDRADAYAEHLVGMLDTVLVAWNGHEWAGLDDDQRAAILDEVRTAWGLVGLVRGWGEIAVAIREDHEEVVNQVDKFRNPERRGDR